MASLASTFNPAELFLGTEAALGARRTPCAPWHRQEMVQSLGTVKV